MTIHSDTVFKLTDQQISSDLAGEKVILNHKKGAYYGLSEVGAFVWGRLEQGQSSFEELAGAVYDEYEVDEAHYRGDISALLEKLVSEKLVEVVPVP